MFSHNRIRRKRIIIQTNINPYCNNYREFRFIKYRTPFKLLKAKYQLRDMFLKSCRRLRKLVSNWTNINIILYMSCYERLREIIGLAKLWLQCNMYIYTIFIICTYIKTHFEMQHKKNYVICSMYKYQYWNRFNLFLRINYC